MQLPGFVVAICCKKQLPLLLGEFFVILMQYGPQFICMANIWSLDVENVQFATVVAFVHDVVLIVAILPT
jgi:hypothetical protein